MLCYDHMNYARYLPVYLTEMADIPNSHYQTSLDLPRNWSVQRQTKYPFSQMACDQTIETTLNRDSKTSGGLVTKTRNSGAVKRWILSQPARSKIVRKCEEMAGINEETRSRKDLDPGAKRTNEEAVGRVMNTIQQMTNPFDGSHQQLVNIASRIVASDTCEEDMAHAYQRGLDCFQKFLEERLFSSSKSFHDTIPRQNLTTFTSRKKKTLRQTDVAEQSDRKIFARLLLLGKTSKLDLRDIMRYSLGNVSFPLSTEDGGLAVTTKSTFRNHLLKKYPSNCQRRPEGGSIIIDGMAIVQAFSVRSLPRTFGEFARAVYNRIISMAESGRHERLDMVFDNYPKINIKSFQQGKRAAGGMGAKRVINSPDQQLPMQWNNYLKNSENKLTLIEFLFTEWASYELPKVHPRIYINHGQICHVLEGKDKTVHIPELSTDQTEADTIMILHAVHAGKDGDVNIVSADTDVTVLALAHADAVIYNLYLTFGEPGNKTFLDVKLMR